MAIKGKKKARGGGRSVARAPRPVLVAARTPVLKRTGIRVTLVLVLLALAALITILALRARDESRKKEDATQDVKELETRMNAIFTAKNVGAPDGLGGFAVLPELGSTLSQVQTGEAKAAEVKTKAEQWEKDAREASEKLAALATGSSELVAADLGSAKALIQQGVTLYASIAKSLAVAVGIEDKDARTKLVESLLEQSSTASSVLSSGFQRITTIKTELEIPIATGAPPGAGFPGGIPPGVPGGVPGGVPDVIPTG